MQTEVLLARWARAFEPLAAQGAYKCAPDDFLVTEIADHANTAEPEGEHLYLYLQKREQTTRELIRGVADANGLPISDIGYAGMKDKQAVTRQWVSVPLGPGADEAPDIVLPDQAIELGRVRRAKKLRRGWHKGNAFELILREVSGAAVNELETRLDQIRNQGVPNYFGEQRFGTDNLTEAIAWLPRRRRERNAFRRGLYLSVLRSFLFNEVLSRRVSDGSWNSVLVGEEQPQGPLWGRGRVQASEAVIALESEALEEFAAIAGELEFAGLKQDRRPLALLPENFDWQIEQTAGDEQQLSEKQLTIKLQFGLPPGTYATTLLRELGEFVQPGKTIRSDHPPAEGVLS